MNHTLLNKSLVIKHMNYNNIAQTFWKNTYSMKIIIIILHSQIPNTLQVQLLLLKLILTCSNDHGVYVVYHHWLIINPCPVWEVHSSYFVVCVCLCVCLRCYLEAVNIYNWFSKHNWIVFKDTDLFWEAVEWVSAF